MTCLTQLVTAGRGAAVLPDDGAMKWRARAPVPRDNGFALVRDPNGRDGLIERGAYVVQRGLHRVPDLVGVVLDPPGLRVVLRELAVGPAERRAVLVDGEGANAGGSGVHGDHDGHAGDARSKPRQ